MDGDLKTRERSRDCARKPCESHPKDIFVEGTADTSEGKTQTQREEKLNRGNENAANRMYQFRHEAEASTDTRCTTMHQLPTEKVSATGLTCICHFCVQMPTNCLPPAQEPSRCEKKTPPLQCIEPLRVHFELFKCAIGAAPCISVIREITPELQIPLAIFSPDQPQSHLP